MKNGISACIQLYYKPVAMITRWKWTCLEILKLEGVLYQNVNTIIYCLQYTLRNLVKALMTFYDCLSCPYYSKCLCLKITVLFHEIILHQCRLLGRYEFKIWLPSPGTFESSVPYQALGINVEIRLAFITLGFCLMELVCLDVIVTNYKITSNISVFWKKLFC